MATERQKRVATGMIANTKTKTPRSSGAIIREAGYGKVALQPHRVIQSQGVQKELMPFTKRLEKFRDKMLSELEGKDLERVEFQHIATALNKITHDIQLLSGGSTDNVFTITWQKDSQVSKD